MRELTAARAAATAIAFMAMSSIVRSARADDFLALRGEGAALVSSSSNRYGGGAGISYAVYPGESAWYLHGYRLGVLGTALFAPDERSQVRLGLTPSVALLLWPHDEGHRLLTYAALEPWLDVGTANGDVDGGARLGLEEEFRWKEIATNLRLGVYYSPTARLGWASVFTALDIEWNLPPKRVSPQPCPPEICS